MPSFEVGTRVLPCNAAPSGGSDGPGKGFLDAKSVLRVPRFKREREASIPKKSVSGGHFGKNPSIQSIQLFPLNAKFLEVTDKSPQGPRHSFPAVWPLKAAPKNWAFVQGLLWFWGLGAPRLSRLDLPGLVRPKLLLLSRRLIFTCFDTRLCALGSSRGFCSPERLRYRDIPRKHQEPAGQVQFCCREI